MLRDPRGRWPGLPGGARGPSLEASPRPCDREWKKWLEQWLEVNRAETPGRYHPIPTPVPAVVSAILYGGLCSITSVVALARALNDVIGNASASRQRFYLDLHLSLPKTSETEYRAWQPDSVTTCLLLRTDPLAVRDLLAPPDPTLPDCGPSDRIVAARLRELFKETLVKHSPTSAGVSLGSIHGLIEAAYRLLRTLSFRRLLPVTPAGGSFRTRFQ